MASSTGMVSMLASKEPARAAGKLLRGRASARTDPLLMCWLPVKVRKLAVLLLALRAFPADPFS